MGSGGLSDEELALAKRLIEVLNLQDISAAEISPTAALFGSQGDSLGLDSIDALEIALMVQQHYGVTLRSEDENVHDIFASLRSLSDHVLATRTR